MTIFASKTAESMNTDPLPWEWIGNTSGAFSGRCAADVPDYAKHSYHGVYSPSQEFTPKTTHEANPILVAVRAAREEGASYQDLLDDINGYAVSYPGADGMMDAFDRVFQEATLEEWQALRPHARRVLTRLANLGELA